jgi:large subunit ribosomal protein L31e
MVEEKIITLNVRKILIESPKWKRSSSYLKILRKLLEKRMKTDKIKIDKKLNERIWKGGIKNPPPKIRVKIIKSDDGSVKIETVE